MFNLLYHYITSPKKTLTYHTAINPASATLLVLSLVSVSYTIHTDASLFILSTLLSFIGLTLLLVITSLVWDFTAQLLHCQAKSLTLFKWLGLSLLPTLLASPLYLLTPIKHPYGLISLLASLLPIATACLQIITIQTLYEITLKKALAIFLIPFLLVPTSLILVIFLLGFVL